MRVLECGCEILQDTGQFISLCDSHGQHMRMRGEAAKHPRNQSAAALPAPAADRAFERELVKVLYPVVLSRWGPGVTDHESVAECVFRHIGTITKRLE